MEAADTALSLFSQLTVKDFILYIFTRGAVIFFFVKGGGPMRVSECSFS